VRESWAPVTSLGENFPKFFHSSQSLVEPGGFWSKKPIVDRPYYVMADPPKPRMGGGRRRLRLRTQLARGLLLKGAQDAHLAFRRTE